MSDESPIELPAPTVAPLVLALGVALAAAGLATSYAVAVIGVALFLFGLGQWIGQLLPGRGHVLEPRAAHRPQTIVPAAAHVERLEAGMPGYRFRLPIAVHPVSAGVRGGLLGGVVMPLPAIAWGVISGHGVWYPANLLAGMVMPGVGELSDAELEQFRPTLLVAAIAIHAVLSLTLGLLYGVLMPTLPRIAKPVAWAALLMPLLWTAASFTALTLVNPRLRSLIEWPWFALSQLIFGLVVAVVVGWQARKSSWASGILAGLAGGCLMPLPAVLWSVASGHGVWYPANLLAAMVVPHVREFSIAELEVFHGQWLLVAMLVHLATAFLFGVAFAVLLPRLPSIPAPLAWGGLLLPLLWTAASYGFMGIVNPVLQQRVAWPWFIASQFVFGVVAAIVVVRSEQVYVAPAGRRQELPSDA